MHKPILLMLAGAALLGSVCSPAEAQNGPPAGVMPQGLSPLLSAGPLVVRQLSRSVYWVEGGAGNAGFIIGNDEVTVVDTTIAPPLAKQLLAEIAKITPKPVKTIILTHGDIDHVGGLAAFPAGLTIIAQENTKARMAAGVAAGRSPVPADHLPNRTVKSREVTTLGGTKVELLHWGPAHTDGDLVVFLPAERIAFTGDVFVLDRPAALIHREQQGSSAGWITTAEAIIALNADRYVVGHGEVQGKQGLRQRLKLVADERNSIQALVAKGKTLAEVQAAVGDPGPVPVKSAPGAPSFPPFSEVVYNELTGKK